jgi:hypothetical protein
MGYTITESKAGGQEYLIIEYPAGDTFEHDFKECLMIAVEEMEELGHVQWAVYCDGPDGDGTRLALIEGRPGASIAEQIRGIVATEWQAAQDWYAEHVGAQR